MELLAFNAEMKTTLDGIAGLRAYSWENDAASPPAAVLPAPERIVYRTTYRGYQTFERYPIVLFVARLQARTALTDLGPYVAATGASSIRAVVEGHAWVNADTVVVEDCDITPVTMAGIDYLGAVFHLTVTGTQ